ncbi:MAG: nucleotidyltransferase domain-containing protein [Anaerolineales bacterium]|nr:nucleotidyltransferase domain-containing protein [Anaerolineales bacterium]
MLRERSFDSVKVISLERDKLLTRLEQIARKILTERREVKEVRLFGSLARGDQVGTSDVDILIILENDLVYSPLEQVRDYYPYFDLPIGVDILLLSGEEVQRRVQAQDDFISRIKREGMTLADNRGK